MNDGTSPIEVETGQVKVARAGTKLHCSAIGSCVAVVIYDQEQQVGGIAHVMLPSTTTYIKGDELLKYANYALKTLIKKLVNLGARKENLKAKLVGGALIVKDSTDVGLENIQAVKDKLAQEGIAVIGERLRGHERRSITFDPATGVVHYTEGGKIEGRL